MAKCLARLLGSLCPSPGCPGDRNRSPERRQERCIFVCPGWGWSSTSPSSGSRPSYRSQQSFWKISRPSIKVASQFRRLCPQKGPLNYESPLNQIIHIAVIHSRTMRLRATRIIPLNEIEVPEGVSILIKERKIKILLTYWIKACWKNLNFNLLEWSHGSTNVLKT